MLTLLSELRYLYETNQMDTKDSIKSITEESKRNKKVKLNSWITEVYFNFEFDKYVADMEEGNDEESDESEEDGDIDE
ncbi:hypothetical protein HPULCUR_005497 [Helicostylum pulchrum]|uniref:Uncharacterized protein n=1 Tax=Helicostylum pulchrum TaxID=562976 RepID=A0ABP9Y0I9_9FUNG